MLFAFILTACQTNNSETKNTIINPVTNTMQTFKSIINGDWYQASYIDSIQETKSPFLSQNSLAEYVELDINTNETTGDSLEIGALNIHEGTSFNVYFKPGLTATSLKTNIIDYDTVSNFYELGYNITANDTSLIIFLYNKNKKLLGQTKYLKAPKSSEGALQYMVNKTLFTGNYIAEDSLGKTCALKFTNDGLVNGLLSYKKYYVLTDFVAGPENSTDEVCFDIQTNNQRCYAFDIKEDTIKLYDVKENADQDTLQRGQLKYKLVKL